MAVKSGAVRAITGKAQHVDLFRKILLRKQLLEHALPGAVYVPFIGDADIASELYATRTVYGADTDTERTDTASGRLPGADIRVADCDVWPFAGLTTTIAIADFDSYSYPYAAFRAFWASAQKAERLVLFFTDGQRQSVKRIGVLHHPSGGKVQLPSLQERRVVFNRYWRGTILPWFTEYIVPWRVLATRFYIRGSGTLYWAAVICSQDCRLEEIENLPESDSSQRVFKKFNARRRDTYLAALRDGNRRTAAARVAQVDYATVWAARKQDAAFAAAEDEAEEAACDPIEDALRSAAESGNVPAIQTWLYNRSKARWKPPSFRSEVSGPNGGPVEVRYDISKLSDEELSQLEHLTQKIADS